MIKSNKNNKTFNIVLITMASIIIVALIVFACINFKNSENNNTESKNSNKGQVTYVAQNENINVVGTKTNTITNEKCNKTTIKNRFSLTIVNGLVQVNNLDTMENFVINKIINVSNMIELNYQKTCDNSIYIILTSDGEIFYTDDNITTIKNLKNIEEEFYYLKSDLRYSELYVGQYNGNIDLYGKTTTGDLYKIDLR